jgi:hypothetical protein
LPGWEVRVSPSENLYKGEGINDVDVLFPVNPELNGNAFDVPQAPSFGIEFDEETAKKHTWKFWKAPHLRRRDGSVTNW